MHFKKLRKSALNSASATLLALAVSPCVFAQEASEDGEFLGTLTLGESKREVQTDTATPVTTIDREEIEDRQASTVAELIDSVPGVSLVNGSTPTGSGINIRGFGANGTYGTDQKVAVMVDGASVGSEELYRIGTQLYTDPSLYRNVEVIRGTVGSFEYGSGIVGGVVKLETIDASDLVQGDDKFAFRQTLGVASNGEGFNSSSTIALKPIETFEVLGNFSWRQQENQEDGHGETIPNSAFELPSYLLKAKLDLGDHEVTASYTSSETADRDVPYDTFGTTSGAFGNVDRDTVSQTMSLSYDFTPESDLIDFSAVISYANQEIDQQYVEGSSPYAPPGGFGVVSADHQYETTKGTFKNTSLFDSGPFEHELLTGFELIKRERQTASSAPGGTDDRYALFIIDQIEFGEGWSFSPAIRYESQQIEGDDELTYDVLEYENDGFMGGASLRYEFDVGFAVFASYAHTKLLPILDDLGNPTYMEQPELADTTEFGASYDNSSVFAEDDSISFKINAFNTRLDDVTSYSRVTDVEISGLEIEGSYATSGGLYTDLNATIFDGKNNTAGSEGDWQEISPNSLRVSFGKRFANAFDLSTEVLATDESNYNGSLTPGYVIVGLRGNYTPQSGVLEGASFRLGVENLLDHAYAPFLSTRESPGRNVKFTVARTF